jgi:large subunit ribosomal protein L18
MSLRTIKKRRRECKTDYKSRMGMIKSNIPRVVIRKTNKYIVAQLVESKEAQDRVIFTTSSKELLKQGFDEKFSGSLKSIPAAYLTGLLMSKKMKKGTYIVDWGLAINKFGGRISAVINGMIDGGLDVKANKKIFPSEERIKGEHLKEEVRTMISKVKENIEKNGK